MSSIVKVKVGKNTYLYESVSFRNEEGKVRNSRTVIGKINLSTGKPIYKADYLAKMEKKGTPVEIPDTEASFSIDDIRRSSIKDYGAFYLFKNIADSIGLIDSIEQALPRYWQEIFTLACYLISSGDSFSYCEDWIYSTESYDVGNMSSQRISELLSAINAKMRDDFYQKWCSYRSEREYLAFDITSTSSYSQLIDEVEWGYNRDHENLPQVNICMLMGEKSKLPIYQTVYSGSLKDVSTLKTTLSQMDSITAGKSISLVFDKGFFSTGNVNAMFNDPSGMKFVIAVPFTALFARNHVENERHQIDNIKNTILTGGETVRGITRYSEWTKNDKIHSHIYFNAIKAVKQREDVYGHVTSLKEFAEKEPAKASEDKECCKYLNIRKSKKQPSGYLVTINEDAVAKALATSGWMVLISNHITDVKEALSIYREKDVVEKGFLRLKTSLDLGRLRVHSSNNMNNKVFIGFISLILLSYMHKVMSDKRLYSKMTMKKLITTLSKLRIQEINGKKIMYPLTKEQKEIYKAFDLTEPV